jgi:transmembrane 9 superfamily protein 2/4
MTYRCLCSENWNWWWRSYLYGASAGLYMYMFCIYRMVFVFQMDLLWGDIVYLLYTLLVSVLFSLMCGTISLTASYTFVKFIYSSVKMD